MEVMVPSQGRSQPHSMGQEDSSPLQALSNGEIDKVPHSDTAYRQSDLCCVIDSGPVSGAEGAVGDVPHTN